MATDMIARMMALDAAQQGGNAYTKAETDALLDGKADLENGTIPLNQIPPAAIERMITVQDDTARFTLTTDDVQLGDTVKVVSTNKMYLVIDTDHLDSAAGYSIYVAGRAAEAVADEDGNNIKSTYAKAANLATVATSGSYNDLSNNPTLGAAAAKGFDTNPTSGNTNNAVSSDGVYQALAAIKDGANIDSFGDVETLFEGCSFFADMYDKKIFTFTIRRRNTAARYHYGLFVYGNVSVPPSIYSIFVDTQNAVTIVKLVGDAGIAYTGSVVWNGAVGTLTISSEGTSYGGIRGVWFD